MRTLSYPRTWMPRSGMSGRPLLVAAGVGLTMLATGALLAPREPAPPLPLELIGDESWLARAEQISRLRLPLFVASLALTPTAFWLFVNGGWSARLRSVLADRGLRNEWLLVASYTAIVTAGLALLHLPVGYAGFIVRRRFGLSSEPQLAWLLRQAGESGVSVVLMVITAQGLYWLLRTFPRRWWILASAGYTLCSLVFVYLQPLIITPLFFKQRPLADPALQARIMQMGAHIGVPVDKVFVIDASKQGNEGNAYFTGIGGATRVVLYDTLLTSYPPDELMTVLAHEMGHWRERHLWKGLALSWLAAPFGLGAAHALLRSVLPRWGIQRPADVAGLPFLLLLLSLATLATLPIQNWQSRRWEADADRIAVSATDDGQAFARTLVRLARQNLSDPAPPRLVEGIFATHPAIGRRVAFALEETLRP